VAVTPSLEDAPAAAVSGYADPQKRPPFAPYLAFIGLFGTLLSTALLIARRQGRSLPEKVNLGELLLVGTASHKVSRLISKDKVTSPLRAPFTELEGKGGPAEFEESSRGTGLQKAVGELLICPYCLGLWVVAGFSVGLLFAPRLTRFIASLFAALTISDFFQIAYKVAEEKGLG
jgi:Protein of unknown function (DUF1360)